MDKVAFYQMVTANPAYNRINLTVDWKIRTAIFEEATYLANSYFPEKDAAWRRSITAGIYDRLINLYLRIHPELDLRDKEKPVA